MSNELIVRDENEFKAIPLKFIKEAQDALQEMMRSVLVENVDFGVIPGTQKRSLWKPGAEKVLVRFRVHVGAPEVTDLSTEDKIHYRIKVPGMTPDGICRGWGIGECCSYEIKYRWRKAICQAEYDEFPPTQRRKKWARDGSYELQVQRDAQDQVNTIIKMAKKRAVVDLCLTCTAASDFFTQDYDDDVPRSSAVRRPKKQKQTNKVFIGFIKQLKQQKGQKGNGEEWTKYSVQLEDDSWVATFSDSLGEKAREILDSKEPIKVKVGFTSDRYGAKMESLELAADE